MLISEMLLDTLFPRLPRLGTSLLKPIPIPELPLPLLKDMPPPNMFIPMFMAFIVLRFMFPMLMLLRVEGERVDDADESLRSPRCEVLVGPTFDVRDVPRPSIVDPDVDVGEEASIPPPF